MDFPIVKFIQVSVFGHMLKFFNSRQTDTSHFHAALNISNLIFILPSLPKTVKGAILVKEKGSMPRNAIMG